MADPVRLILDDGTDRLLPADRVWNVYQDHGGLAVHADNEDEGNAPPLGRIIHFGQWLFRATDEASAALVRVNGQRPPPGRVVPVPPDVHLQLAGRTWAFEPAPVTARTTDSVPVPVDQTPIPRQRTEDEPSPEPETTGTAIVVGRRGTGADLELDDPRVLGRHATAHPKPDGAWLVRPERGLVFVNRRPLSHRGATLSPGDRFIVGQTVVTVPRAGATPGARTRTSAGNGLAVRAEHLSAAYGDEYALKDVTFDIEPGDLVAVIGPSGAGASTLVWAMMGGRRLIDGRLFLGGEQVHPETDPQLMRRLVRYVPRRDDLYPALTVRQTLTQAARLRAAPDTPGEEIDARVVDVLDRLRLTDQAGQRVGELSGGQRRRACIGVELVGRPQLLLLDEPTGGLDLAEDRQVMDLLREVSDDGCTTVVITHSTAHLDRARRVMVLARGGSLYGVGSVGEALAKGGDTDWPDLLERVARFRPTRLPRNARARPTLRRTRTVPAQDRPPASATRDLRVLVDRQLWLLARGGWKSTVALLAMPLIGALLGAAASGDGLRPGPDLTLVLAIMTTIATLTGAALSYQNIVEETGALRRDWRAGTGTRSLVQAKALVYLGVCAVLAAELVATFGLVRPLMPDAFGVGAYAAVGLTWFLVMSASMCLGLLVSATAPSLKRAVTVNTLLAILQVVLNGSLFRLPVGLAQASLVLPARLGYAAAANYADLNAVRRGGYTDGLWVHSAPRFGALLIGLAVVAFLAVRVAAWLLERDWRRAEWLVKGRHRRRRRTNRPQATVLCQATRVGAG